MPTNTKRAFNGFTERLKLLIQTRPDLITITLSNILQCDLSVTKRTATLRKSGLWSLSTNNSFPRKSDTPLLKL
jgi:hypothetical protein